MNKKSLFCGLVLMVSMAQAAVSDFNTLINEAYKGQVESHVSIQKSVSNQVVVRKKQPEIIKGEQEIVHVKTQKGFLKFAKEKSYFKANDIKNEKRLAEEFQNLE